MNNNLIKILLFFKITIFARVSEKEEEIEAEVNIEEE